MPLNELMLILGASVLVGGEILDHIAHARVCRECSRRIRLALPALQCRRCNGPLGDWDGQLGPIRGCRAYDRPPRGGRRRFFRKRIEVRCRVCKRSAGFLLRSDGVLVSQDDAIDSIRDA